MTVHIYGKTKRYLPLNKVVLRSFFPPNKQGRDAQELR